MNLHQNRKGRSHRFTKNISIAHAGGGNRNMKGRPIGRVCRVTSMFDWLSDWRTGWFSDWTAEAALRDYVIEWPALRPLLLTRVSLKQNFPDTTLLWDTSLPKYWSPELLVAIRQWRKDLGSRLQVWCLDIPCITRWSRTIKDRQDSSSPRKAHSITDVFHVARGAIHGGYWQKGSLRVIWAEVPMRLNQAPEAHHQIPQLTHP